MFELWLLIIPIALIDSFTPVRFTILSGLLGTSRPVIMGYSFVMGIFVGYFCIGFLVLLGLDKVADKAGSFLKDQYNAPVDAFDLLLQLIIGVLLVVFAYRSGRPRNRSADAVEEETSKEGLHPMHVFLLGAVPAFLPTPGMLPYFAALDQTLRADLSTSQIVMTLLFYNVVFLVPPTALIIIRVISEKWSKRIFQSITRSFATWGKGAIIVLVILLGLVLIVDAIAYALGHPILPTHID